MMTTFLLFRFKSVWNNRFKPSFWGLHFLYLGITVLYAWAISSVFTLANTSEGDFINREEIEMAIGAMWVFSIFLRSFLPQYQPLFSPVPPHWPVSPWQRYGVSVLHDLQQGYFFYVLLWILLTISMKLPVQWATGFFWLGCLLSAHFFMRLIQYGLDYRYKTKIKLTGVYLISALLIIGIFGLRSDRIQLSLGITMAGIFWFLMGYFLSIQPKERRSILPNRSWLHSTGAFKALFYNKKVRFLLLMAVVLKTAVLAGTVWLGHAKGKSVMETQFFYWIFFSPLIFNTYVYNNTWGFWRMNWITIYLRSGDIKDFVKEYLRLFQVPWVLDVLITSVAILAMPFYQEVLLVYYLTSSITLLPLSILTSFWVPKKVNSAFQAQGGSSQIMAFVMMFLLGILMTIQLNYWFYILIPVYLGIGIVSFWNLKNLARKQRHAIFKELFT